MLNRITIFCVALVLLGACAAKPLLPGSEQIILSKEAPPIGCRYIAEVTGSQGNFWTAEFTNDADLIHGARNELRNGAMSLHANYVQIETESFSQNTGEDSLGGTYSAVIIGNAYNCTAESLITR